MPAYTMYCVCSNLDLEEKSIVKTNEDRSLVRNAQRVY